MEHSKFDIIDTLLSDSTFKLFKKILTSNRKHKLNLDESKILNVIKERYNKLCVNKPDIKLYDDEGNPLFMIANGDSITKFTITKFTINKDLIDEILSIKKDCKWYFNKKLKEYIRYTPGYSTTSSCYSQGESAGESDGKSDGNAQGEIDGNAQGEIDGNTQGTYDMNNNNPYDPNSDGYPVPYPDPYPSAYGSGYPSSCLGSKEYSDGYSYGYSYGYTEGYTDGYKQAYEQAYTQAYEQAYPQQIL